MTTAFIDTNILFYAFGREHPLKKPCRDLMLKFARGEVDAVTNAEVLQEILYVYWQRRELKKGGEVFNAAQSLLTDVLPVDLETMNEAHRLLTKYPDIHPRDAVHAATVLVNNIPLLITADTHFKHIKEIKVKLVS